MTSLSRPETGWQLSGLYDEDGNLERPADPAMWLREAVERRGDVLIVGAGFLEPPMTRPVRVPRSVRAGRGMLEGFVRLADDETGDRIAAYARRWGFLDLCEHGLPASHNPAPGWCRPLSLDEGEPVEGWRRWAGQARAILAILARLSAGEPGLDEDWQRVFAGSRLVAPWWREGTAESADGDRWRVRSVINDWTVLGNVRPWLVDYGPHLVIGGGGLFGALAVQLVLLASGSDSVCRCSACGSPFVPTGRRPAAGRRRYCADCRERGVPVRDAKRDHRARMAAVR